MSTIPVRRSTPSEYLAIERAADHRSEFFRGEMFAMAGASYAHNLIVSNLVRELGNRTKGGPCQTLSSDMRLLVEETGLYTYPDALVICDPPEFVDDRRDTLVNPTIVLEVLSKSTEVYDRGKKSSHYRQLASLREYMLVSQDEARIEHYARQPDGHWLLTDAVGLDSSLSLPTLSCEIPLAEIYARVEFRAEESTDRPQI